MYIDNGRIPLHIPGEMLAKQNCGAFVCWSLRRIDQLALPPLLFITLPITLPLWLHPTVGPAGAIRTFPFNGAFPARSFSGFLHFSALFAAFHL